MNNLRVGTGFDVHKFAEGRKLILGGIELEYELGLDGHSDADVLLHAIMDALLGAAGLPDIGQHFPPTDDEYKDADSGKLLQLVDKMLLERNWHIVNIDSVIMAQEPKMNPHIPRMKERIAELLEIELGQINIKATTTEKLGFTGRKEGIAAQAVCLLVYNG